MKKLVPLLLILIILPLVLFGCTDESDDFELREDMSAENLFDMIERADSFSVKVGENDYRFIKNRGYSIFESTDGGMIYEGFFIEDDTLYMINSSPKTGLSEKYREAKEEDFDKIFGVYYKYVQNVKGSYGTVTKDGEEIAVEVKDNEAVVKTIYRPKEGYLEIKQCRVYGINDTELYIPLAYKDYKEKSVYESLS